MTATSDANKAATAAFFDGVFNHGDMSLVTRLLSPDYHMNGQPSDPAGTIAWAEGLRAHFPGLQFVIEAILAEDDKVAVRWRMMTLASAEQPAGHVIGTNILVFAGGQAISNDQSGGTPADFVADPA